MSQRLTLDRHTINSLAQGKCSRLVRWGPEPKVGQCAIFRLGDKGSAVCRIEITSQPVPTTFDELMADGDAKSALEHGAPHVTEFRRRWLAQHDRVVKRLTGDEIAALTGDEIAEHWSSWRPVRVWGLQVRLDTLVRDRYLAPVPWENRDRMQLVDELGEQVAVPNGGDLARGYVSFATAGLPGEHAAVGDVELLRYAAEAGDNDAARRRQALYDLEQMLERLTLLDADSRNVKVIKRQIEEMRARGDRNAA